MEIGKAFAEVLPASHRRALAQAADYLIDTTFSELSSGSDLTWTNDRWLLGTMLPPRYEHRYNLLFAKKFFVCLITVIWKLGQDDAIGPSCVAEELAAHVLIEEASGILVDEEKLEADFGAFEDMFFEDTDFEYLYAGAYDGIEKSEIAAEMGIDYLAFSDWFRPFGTPEGSTRPAVHPYVREDKEPTDPDANTDANPDDIR